MYKLYREKKKLIQLEEKSFYELGLKERFDIEEWIEKNPETLDEELLIIAKEFCGFDKTNERLDLLALDTSGNVVIIELKRDDSGKSVDWQAIKYASYCSQLIADDLIEIYSEYKEISKELASREIYDFVGDNTILNEEQRIILVSRKFRTEVTSSVMWLLDKGINVKCVKISPYYDSKTKEVYIDFITILPPPETEQYIIQRARVEKEQNDKRKKVKEYTIEYHLNKGDEKIRQLYYEISNQIKEISYSIQEKYTYSYIAFREKKDFTSLIIRKSKISILIFPEVEDEETTMKFEFISDKDSYHLKKRFHINSKEQISKAIQLIRKSYELQK